MVNPIAIAEVNPISGAVQNPIAVENQGAAATFTPLLPVPAYFTPATEEQYNSWGASTPGNQ